MRERNARAGMASLTGAGLAAVLALALATATGTAAVPGRALPQMADSTPHSDARLISEVASIRPGQPFTVGVHITLDEGWHTYWRNAGDAGTGTIPTWRLPAGFRADSLRYPHPERIPYPPLLNYGYHDEVVLLAEVTPPPGLEPGTEVDVALDVDFLVCEDVCIPARAAIGVTLPVLEEEPALSDGAPLIRRFRDRLPIRSDAWSLRVARTDTGFVIGARPPDGWDGSLAGAYFFPHDPITIRHTPGQAAGTADGELRLTLVASEYLSDEPDRLDGILTLPEGSAFDAAGHRALAVEASIERGQVAWASEPVTLLAQSAAATRSARADGGLTLVVALLFAFVGGLILNLMPCVFPILSLKALGFATRGGDRAGMRRDGLAFGAGVVLTFLVVAGILIGIRATGAEVGWGYQLQSPAVVALLAALMFGIGLILAGVVELGASLTRVGGLGGADGERSAFLTGVLATIVATPCTAPFMGAAIGAALVRPPVEGLAVFAGLGVGMATPYVTLAFWPSLARRLPRPGRWMETFKQALAFPMFAVAVWLVWVFGLQVGIGGAARLLFGLLLLAMAAWLIGRWPAIAISTRVRAVTRGLAAAALLVAILAGVAAVRDVEPLPGAPVTAGALSWEAFSDDAVAAHREAGRPVFVDFTAAWCISCQVNERVALETAAVRQAFAEHDVALLKADWTRRDPAITRALERFGRSGVPLYVLYPPDPAAEPRILPALLTQRIVLDALRDLGDGSAVRRQAAAESD